MSGFPLYDLFLKEAKSLPALSEEQKMKFVENVKILDKDGIDELYMLIRYASQLEQDEKVYGAKYHRKGVVFNLDSLSDELQKVLWAFMQKRLQIISAEKPSVDIVFE